MSPGISGHSFEEPIEKGLDPDSVEDAVSFVDTGRGGWVLVSGETGLRRHRCNSNRSRDSERQE